MEDFIQINEEILNGTNYYYKDDIEDFLCDNVIKNKKDFTYLNIKDFREALLDCESPIEQILAIAIKDSRIEYINHYNPFIDLGIATNQEIKCKNGKKYRLDFYIVVAYMNKKGKIIKNAYLDIECDGKDYHSTKEQIKYDNKRSRDLIEEGFEIIRFSGSEINDNPYNCIDEILKIILSKCEYR